MHKEMVLAHSSYARAAGIQSEINKVTVTRVAGSEVEYQRQMNLHRKNMMITVRNIRREQKKLRKSMTKYSQKIKEGRRERERREREDFIRDKKSFENMENVSAIFIVRQPFLPNIKKEEKLNESPDSGIADVSEEPKESQEYKEKINIEPRLNTTETVEENEQIPHISFGDPLPSILEDNEGADEGDNEPKLELNSPDNSINKVLESKLKLHLRALKPKKQTVSFSDLIKLQHSTNTKKLFNLVNILAQKHGLKDREDTKEKESRNSSNMRGSTDESMSLRAASVLYPMKYGYDSGTESEMSLPGFDTDKLASREVTYDESEIHSNLHLTSEVQLSPKDTLDKGEISVTHLQVPEEQNRGKKRNKSLPALMDEHQKSKLEQVNRTINSEHSRRNSIATRSPKTRFLPPIQKQPSEEVTYRSSRSNSISWTEAFGLLKGVHSLQEQ